MPASKKLLKVSSEQSSTNVLQAMGKLGKNVKTSRKKHQTTNGRAGLTFPIQKVMNLMRKDRLNQRIQKKAAIMMAGVIQYIAEEIFESAGSIAEQKHKKRITNRHLALAIANDPELNKCMPNAIIYQGGVSPYIHPALLQKKGKKMEEAIAPVNLDDTAS